MRQDKLSQMARIMLATSQLTVELRLQAKIGAGTIQTDKKVTLSAFVIFAKGVRD